MGLQAKLTQNLILSNILMAFNEGMVLATKGGVEPKLMLDILENSAAKSGLISYKAPFVFRRDFQANFSTKWMDKDISLALGVRPGAGSTPTFDRFDPPTLPDSHRRRPCR